MGIPLNIDWQQILLHLFNFAILTGGLYFLLYSPVKKFMEKREEYYRAMDHEAASRLQEAQKREEQAEKQLEQTEQAILEKQMKAEAELHASLDRKIQEAKTEDREIVALTKEAAARIIYSDTEEAYKAFLEIAEREEKHEQ